MIPAAVPQREIAEVSRHRPQLRCPRRRMELSRYESDDQPTDRCRDLEYGYAARQVNLKAFTSRFVYASCSRRFESVRDGAVRLVVSDLELRTASTPLSRLVAEDGRRPSALTVRLAETNLGERPSHVWPGYRS